MKIVRTSDENQRPRPKKYEPPVEDPEEVPEEYRLTSGEQLTATAAMLSRLVYLSHEVSSRELERLGASRITRVSGPSRSTIADCCVLNGRAWIVFRGSNDGNDWIRNTSAIPFYHYGFNRCLEDVEAELMLWCQQLGKDAEPFCLTGHSLGGALATLAAKRLAEMEYSVLALQTFGAPRALGLWSARKFNNTTLKPLDGVPPTLGGRSLRFKSDKEIVTGVVPRILGYSHIGERGEFPRVKVKQYGGGYRFVDYWAARGGSSTPVTGSVEEALSYVGNIGLGGIEILFQLGAEGLMRAAYHEMRLYFALVRADEVHEIDWQACERDSHEPSPELWAITRVVGVLRWPVLIAIAALLGWFVFAIMGETGLVLLGVGIAAFVARLIIQRRKISSLVFEDQLAFTSLP